MHRSHGLLRHSNQVLGSRAGDLRISAGKVQKRMLMPHPGEFQVWCTDTVLETSEEEAGPAGRVCAWWYSAGVSAGGWYTAMPAALAGGGDALIDETRDTRRREEDRRSCG